MQTSKITLLADYIRKTHLFHNVQINSEAVYFRSFLGREIPLSILIEGSLPLEDRISDQKIYIGFHCSLQNTPITQDWIQTLANDYNEMDLAALVVVCDGGFTDSALEVAKHHNIVVSDFESAKNFHLNNFSGPRSNLELCESSILLEYVLKITQNFPQSFLLSPDFEINMDNSEWLPCNAWLKKMINISHNPIAGMVHSLPVPEKGFTFRKFGVVAFKLNDKCIVRDKNGVEGNILELNVRNITTRKTRFTMPSYLYRGTQVIPQIHWVKLGASADTSLKVDSISDLSFYATDKNDEIRTKFEKQIKLKIKDDSTEEFVKRKFSNFQKSIRDKGPFAVEEVPKYYQKLLDEVGFFIQNTLVRPPPEQWYVRANPVSDFDSKNRPNTLRQSFSYPPAQYAKQWGRANLPYNPVFYATERVDVALAESNAVNGQEFYVSIWRSKDLKIKYLLSRMSDNVATQRLLAHAKEQVKIIELSHRDIGPLVTELTTISLKCLSEMFLDDDWTASSTIAYQLLYNDNIDAIEYPDVKTRQSYNYAIHPRIADQLELFKVVHLSLSGDEWCFLGVGEVENEGQKVVWRKFSNKDNLEDVFGPGMKIKSG